MLTSDTPDWQQQLADAREGAMSADTIEVCII